MSGGLEKFGVYRGCKDPAILFFGLNESAFDGVSGLIDELSAPAIRLVPVVLCMDIQGRKTLAERYRNARVISPPVGGFVAWSVLLSTLKVRVIVDASQLPGDFSRAIGKRATPVLSSAALISASPEVAREKIVQLAGRERKWQDRKNRPVGRFFANWLHRRLQEKNGSVGGGGQIRRYGDIAALKTRLGRPGVIMCLGNGPSSEDPRLLAMEHDVLFRANHGWMKRGFLDQPDVVFTGMQASMKKVKSAVICVLGDTTEKVLLMTRAVNFFQGRLEYAVAGGSGGFIEVAEHETFRPTSGAVMLSAAVALKPRRLIVAGIDMFRHPEGAYPGDKTTTNAYTATHDHDHELAFILARLEEFDGELVIVSKVLQAEWDGHRKGS